MNSFELDESKTRNSLQELLLENGNNKAVLNGILARVRETDMGKDSDEPPVAVDFVPFIEELCLAADFYLLPCDRVIRFIGASENTKAILPIRKTERDFFFITSRLLLFNKRVTVQMSSDRSFLFLSFYCENPLTVSRMKNGYPLLDGNFWLLAEKNSLTPILRFRKTDKPPVPCPADFSLLLCDKMSELNKWFFDVE